MIKKLAEKLAVWILTRISKQGQQTFDSEITAIQTFQEDLIVATKMGSLYRGKDKDWKKLV